MSNTSAISSPVIRVFSFICYRIYTGHNQSLTYTCCLFCPSFGWGMHYGVKKTRQNVHLHAYVFLLIEKSWGGEGGIISEVQTSVNF